MRVASLPDQQRTAQSLLPSIESLLEYCRWRPDQLDLICVTTGPGSFTGLRIGVTTAKTLAYATGAQLVEVHTLAALAAGVSAPYRRLWTVLDAQRQELYVVQFRSDWQSQPHVDPDTRIVTADEWLQKLQPGDVVTGPPLSKLAQRLPSGVVIAVADQWRPQAETVGHLGVAAYREGRVVDRMQLVPRYYRKSAAEEKAGQ